MTGRRIVSIFLPRLAIESWLQQRNRQGEAWPEELPVALAAPGPQGPVVHAANRAGEQAGARPGARVADCRSICPELRIEDAQPAQDAARLTRLAFWVRRWGPFSAVDGQDGLILDVTGTTHLFGGESALLAAIQADFARAGLGVQLGMAATRGAAWALARLGPERAICTAPLPALSSLSVAGLRLSPPTVLLLRRLGLKTIGDLAALPRLPLMRRFARAEAADNPLIRLDQALGRLAEPLDAPEPAPEFAAEVRLAEPAMDPSDWLAGLLRDLCAQLSGADRGCRQLCLSVFRVDGERRDIRIALASPTRDPAHLLRLFQGRLDRLDPGYGFDLIRLMAESVEALDQSQPGLGGGDPEALELSRLVDRLVARFGAATLSRPLARDSHIPERSQTPGAPLDDSPAPAARPDRPLRLLTPPEEIRVLYAIPEGPPAQFIWRRQTLRIARHAGPERIAPEWWQDRPGTRLRDYFRVEDEVGRRLWIYREGLAHDGRGGAPRWFLHGIFA
jgi:protein ImuB